MGQLCPLQLLAPLIAACERVPAWGELAGRVGYCGKGAREISKQLSCSGSENSVPSSHSEHGSQGRRVAAQEGAD